MIEYDRYNWLATVFAFRGTALRHAAGRVAALTFFAVVVQIVYESMAARGGKHVDTIFGINPAEHAVLGSLLGFLIVFRMNASNNRYWEGRSLWGQMINASRNLVRAGVAHTDGGAELADLVSGYVITVRRALHGNMDTRETEAFLPEAAPPSGRSFRKPAHRRRGGHFRMDRPARAAGTAQCADGAAPGTAIGDDGGRAGRVREDS